LEFRLQPALIHFQPPDKLKLEPQRQEANAHLGRKFTGFQKQFWMTQSRFFSSAFWLI
jgi:hypothetical protein